MRTSSVAALSKAAETCGTYSKAIASLPGYDCDVHAPHASDRVYGNDCGYCCDRAYTTLQSQTFQMAQVVDSSSPRLEPVELRPPVSRGGVFHLSHRQQVFFDPAGFLP